MELDSGDGLGFQPAASITPDIILEDGSVGKITEDPNLSTCYAGTDKSGNCTVNIYSDVPGDTHLVIDFNTDFTKSKFNFVTRWWAGTADIHKNFEMGPYTTIAPQACMTITRTDGGWLPQDFNPERCTPNDLVWEGLPAGSYRLDESENGTYIPMQTIYFDIDTSRQDFRGPTIENKLKPGELQIIKEHYNEAPWTGPEVTFEIYDCNAAPDCSVLAAVVSIPGQDISNEVSISLHEGEYLPFLRQATRKRPLWFRLPRLYLRVALVSPASQ